MRMFGKSQSYTKKAAGINAPRGHNNNVKNEKSRQLESPGRTQEKDVDRPIL